MVREQTRRGRVRRKPTEAPGSIWDTPHIKEILSQPVGTPMNLSKEEARAIVDSVLQRPDRTKTEEYKRAVREMRRIRKEAGALLVRPSADD